MKKFMQLILLVVLSLFTVPLSAIAQEPLHVAIVNFVSHPSLDEIEAGIYEELEKQDYIEGDNLTIDYFNAEGDMNLLTSIADQVVHNQPDLIFAITTPVAQVFQHATSEIPIIFAGVTDPIDAGILIDNDKPGANITGTRNVVDLKAHFDFVFEIQPDIEVIGMIYSTNEDSALVEIEEAKALVEDQYGVEVIVEGIASTMDMQLVADKLAGEVDAIYVPTDNLIASSFPTLLDATDAKQIAVYPPVDLMIEQGGLAGAAIDQGDLGREAVRMGLEVIAGKSIAEIPAIVPEDIRLMYNPFAAERVGIEIPQSVLDSNQTTAVEQEVN